MYISRNKTDLMIEVWERLDCESIGAAEITAIENAVKERFGSAAVPSPMVIARLLADEGAELRHSEIMALFVERWSDRPYDAALRNILKLDTLAGAETSIRNSESLRVKLAGEGDKEGLRLLRQDVVEARDEALRKAAKAAAASREKLEQAEIAEWLSHWLRTPEMFATWLALRKRSADYKEKFGGKEQ